MKYFLEELEAASRTNHFGANLQYDDLSADCAFDAEQDLPAIVEIENFDPIPLHKLVKCRTESPACVNSDLDKFIETAKRRKLTEEEIATMIVDELLANYVFGCDGNALRVYKPKRGYFKLCPLESTSGTSLTKLIMNKTSYGGSSLKKNVVEKVAKVLINKDGLAVKLEKQHADFVNLRDAAFCLQTETLHEHSPEIRATYYIDAVYTTEPMSEKSKAFFRHLGASTRGVTALFQIIGLALTNVRNLQTAGLLVGPPGSGKSVLLQFLQCVMSIGAAKTFEFSSMLKLSERTNLLGAQLSICSELSTDIIPAQAVALFKQITSGEKIQVRQLYKDVVDFKPNCFLLLCGNTLPAIEDESGAFERRLLTVETGPTIPESERNPHLLEELLDDRHAIVSEALRHAAAIYKGTEEIIRIPVSLKKTFGDPNIAITHWYNANVVQDATSEVPAQDLWTHFNLNSGLTLTLNGFSARFAKLFPHLCKIRKRNISLYSGIRLRQSTIEIETQPVKS